MSWFEQGTSSLRCNLTQFHRLAKLKLTRTEVASHSRMFIEHTGFLCPSQILRISEVKKMDAGSSGSTWSIPPGNDDPQKTGCSQNLRVLLF